MTRRVCISGAGSGIGREIALCFAAEGASLTLLGRRQNRLDETDQFARAAGAADVASVVLDLREPDVIAELLDTSAAGPFDVVIANAGGNAALAPDRPAVDGSAWATWHWTENFRTNVLTAVHLVEGLRELDAIAPGGSIVLLSSIAAFRGSGNGSYAGTKAALHPYAFDLASGLGASGVTVNVVAPGYIAETEFFPDGVSAQRLETLSAQALNGRAGEPADVASTVTWLCGAGARHVTGQIIQVNGGALLGR